MQGYKHQQFGTQLLLYEMQIFLNSTRLPIMSIQFKGNCSLNLIRMLFLWHLTYLCWGVYRHLLAHSTQLFHKGFILGFSGKVYLNYYFEDDSLARMDSLELSITTYN